MTKQPLSAGVARRIITPPKGIYQIGYGDRTKGNIGVHDDLTATALVLDDGKARVAVLALDILTINEFIVDRVRARLTPTEVLLCCSHTHSGPIAYADEKSSRRIRKYIDSLVNNIVDAVSEAQEIFILLGWSIHMHRSHRHAAAVLMKRPDKGYCSRDRPDEPPQVPARDLVGALNASSQSRRVSLRPIPSR